MCTLQYQNSSEDQPRYTDRAARSLIKLFNIDDISWQQEMDLIEKLIEEAKAASTGGDVNLAGAITSSNTRQCLSSDPSYDMNHLTGLRYRLKAVGGHDHPVRELGVQHKVGAKMSKMKMIRNCKDCCCVNHCLLTGHDRSDVSFDHFEASVEYKFPNMLDKSWNESEDYEQGVIDTVPLVEDRLMSLLCAVNTDFTGMETEPDALVDSSF